MNSDNNNSKNFLTYNTGITVHAFMYTLADVTVSDMGAGHCLGPEGNGVSLRKGGEGGPGPPGSQ
jgi:hypothetical protein